MDQKIFNKLNFSCSSVSINSKNHRICLICS
ncbi:hypothetical protein J562_4283, partial [Acinetobacter baumannii 1440750]